MRQIFKPLIGVIAAMGYTLNLIVIPLLVIIIALLQKITPIPPIRRFLYRILHSTLPAIFFHTNNFIMNVTTPTRWHIDGKGTLSKNGWYFVMCNHQSWLDILALQRVFHRKIPLLKFFMKQELLWTLPIGGLAAKLLDFPFMKRHTKEFLKKHPEQRDKDIETTKRSCERFKDSPIAIMNYLEGTRFTPEKRAARHSPYQHLLPPKAGGMAFVFATMSEVVHELIDVTIVYNPERPTLWQFMCGEVRDVFVSYEVIKIPDELRGDYYHDKSFRKSFQQWLNQRWEQKDQLITELNIKAQA